MRALPRTLPPVEHAPVRRRSAGLVVAMVLLLSVLAAGAWAALRWEDLEPKLIGLLNEARVATVGDADPVAPRAEPVRSEPVSPPAAMVAPPAAIPAAAAAAAVTPRAEVAGEPAMEGTAVQQAALPQTEPVPPSSGAAAAQPASRTESAEAGVKPVPAQESARPADEAPALVVAPVSNRQDLQPSGRSARTSKRILVQRGDTLMNLVARQYGFATYTVLDVVRAANPGVQDVNRIIAGSELVFPDPGPSARVVNNDNGVSVLVRPLRCSSRPRRSSAWSAAATACLRISSRSPSATDAASTGFRCAKSRIRCRRCRSPSRSAASCGTLADDPEPAQNW